MEKVLTEKYTFSFIAPSKVIEEIKSDMRFSTFIKVSENPDRFRPSIKMRFWRMLDKDYELAGKPDLMDDEYYEMDVIGYDKKAMEDVHEFIRQNGAVMEISDIQVKKISKPIYW